MILIPLEQIPNQEFEIILNNQECKIHLYIRGEYLYFDLLISETPVFYGAVCYDRIKILPIKTDIFNGNFIFIDNLGSSNPEYTKLNERYELYYLDEKEAVEFDNLQLGSGK